MLLTTRLISRSCRSAVRTGFRTMLFLSVFISFWQAPVPVIHQHCLTSGVVNAQTLALHLASLHADEMNREDDWHLHFVMLDDLMRGSGLPIPPQDGQSPVLPKEHVVLGDHFQSEATSLSAPTILAWSAEPSVIPSLGLSERTLFGLSSAEKLTPSCRLHLVLCVARC